MNILSLPSRDDFTDYDYRLGASRMSIAKAGYVRFIVTSNMPVIINFGEQFEWLAKNKLVWHLSISYPGTDTVVTMLSKEKTAEFALKCIEKYGKENGEKVLSATTTGALYWNMIHHYETYDNFLSHNLGK